jgi:hypothetical protein
MMATFLVFVVLGIKLGIKLFFFKEHHLIHVKKHSAANSIRKNLNFILQVLGATNHCSTSYCNTARSGKH